MYHTYGLSIFSDDLDSASVAVFATALEPNTRAIVTYTRLTRVEACFVFAQVRSFRSFSIDSSLLSWFLQPPLESSSILCGCWLGLTAIWG